MPVLPLFADAHVEYGYVQVKDESRAQLTDSSKAYTNTNAFNCFNQLVSNKQIEQIV